MPTGQRVLLFVLHLAAVATGVLAGVTIYAALAP